MLLSNNVIIRFEGILRGNMWEQIPKTIEEASKSALGIIALIIIVIGLIAYFLFRKETELILNNKKTTLIKKWFGLLKVAVGIPNNQRSNYLFFLALFSAFFSLGVLAASFLTFFFAS